ncbi:DUF4352 domain-containing protein, partial [Enterococcus faecium]|uniref:DUF4352 domain-containing protein n=1 Tax=Enterococcus faecium TaxID=1352 RepID=UPI0023B32339
MILTACTGNNKKLDTGTKNISSVSESKEIKTSSTMSEESKEIKTSSTMSEETAEDKEEKKSKYEDRYVNGLDISILEVSKSKKDDNKSILSIKVKGSNKSNGAIGFGSIDFHLKDNDTQIDPFVDGVNFGEEIPKGSEIEGIMTFEIPNELHETKLVYQIGDKEEASWTISF